MVTLKKPDEHSYSITS